MITAQQRHVVHGRRIRFNLAADFTRCMGAGVDVDVIAIVNQVEHLRPIQRQRAAHGMAGVKAATAGKEWENYWTGHASRGFVNVRCCDAHNVADHNAIGKLIGSAIECQNGLACSRGFNRWRLLRAA